ncbi:MAG: serine hydrolase, partial [Anaerolineales bacterium]
MTLKGLGTRSERGGGLPIVSLVSTAFLLMGVFLFGQELMAYSDQDVAALQADVIIAGVQVGGLNEAQAQARWEEIYLDQPITLVYRDSPMIFSPRTLGFRTNNEAMLTAARTQSDGEQNFWTGFWAYLWNERTTSVEVPLNATLQEGQLRGVLEDIARRYDSEAQDIGFDLTTLTFQSGAQGSRLDTEASIPLIEAALFNTNPAERRVELPTQGVRGSGADMDDLRQAIISYMEAQGVLYDAETTIVSVFVMDLNTGEEMSILGDVAHSGVSTIKVPIMVNYFRHQVAVPDPDTSYLMASAMICSHNPGANFLMQVTSPTRNNMIEGLRLASETMLDMGAINSWITSPLFVGPDGEYPIIQPPARDNLANPDYNAQPDPFNQTTAEDMGTVLAHIYDCAMNSGGLRAVFPDEVTQTECQQMLEVLRGVRFERFSEIGAPPEVEIAHKVGYGDET